MARQHGSGLVLVESKQRGGNNGSAEKGGGKHGVSSYAHADTTALFLHKRKEESEPRRQFVST